MSGSPLISAFIVTCDKPKLLRACLQRLQGVADELVVVDKSRVEAAATQEVASIQGARYYTRPWSPLGEDDRNFGMNQTTHDWVIGLDDDEILSPGAGSYLRYAAQNLPATVFYLPSFNHVLGSCDFLIEPDLRPVFYKRDALTYVPMVHTGPIVYGQKAILRDPNLFIQHLSNATISEFLQKTDRYTAVYCDRTERERILADVPVSLVERAVGLINGQLSKIVDDNQYRQALALMTTIYELVQLLKIYESTRLNGNEAFAAICAAIEEEAAAQTALSRGEST